MSKRKQKKDYGIKDTMVAEHALESLRQVLPGCSVTRDIVAPELVRIRPFGMSKNEPNLTFKCMLSRDFVTRSQMMLLIREHNRELELLDRLGKLALERQMVIRELSAVLSGNGKFQARKKRS